MGAGLSDQFKFIAFVKPLPITLLLIISINWCGYPWYQLLFINLIIINIYLLSRELKEVAILGVATVLRVWGEGFFKFIIK